METGADFERLLRDARDHDHDPEFLHLAVELLEALQEFFDTEIGQKLSQESILRSEGAIESADELRREIVDLRKRREEGLSLLSAYSQSGDTSTSEEE